MTANVEKLIRYMWKFEFFAGLKFCLLGRKNRLYEKRTLFKHYQNQ